MCIIKMLIGYVKDIVNLICIFLSHPSQEYFFISITEYHWSYSRRRVSMIYKHRSRCSGH